MSNIIILKVAKINVKRKHMWKICTATFASKYSLSQRKMKHLCQYNEAVCFWNSIVMTTSKKNIRKINLAKCFLPQKF